MFQLRLSRFFSFFLPGDRAHLGNIPPEEKISYGPYGPLSSGIQLKYGSYGPYMRYMLENNDPYGPHLSCIPENNGSYGPYNIFSPGCIFQVSRVGVRER